MPEKSSLNLYSRGAQEHSCCAVAKGDMLSIVRRERRTIALFVFVASATVLGDGFVRRGRQDILEEES